MATLKKIAEQKNWEYDKGYMYGEVNNYLVTMKQHGEKFKTLFIPLANITEEHASMLFSYLKENRKQLRLIEYKLKNSILMIKLNEGFKGYKVEHLDELLNKLTSYFSSNNISNDVNCVYCGQNNTDAISKINNISFHAHKGCIQSALEKVERDNEEFKFVNKNYLRGTIGAILGAMIGAIPWIILERAWGFVAILAIVIGYGAFYGYKMFGGIVTKRTKWIVGFAILLGIIFSQIVNIGFEFMQYDIELSLENYIIAYTDPEIASNLYTNLAIGMFIGLIGFYNVFKKVQEQEHGVKIS